MASIYYRIWADAIISQKAKKAEQANWKILTLIPISVLMGLNLLTFFYWMKIINRNLPMFFIVNIFSYKSLNSFISVLITFFIPFLILNYLLIFSNERYVKLLQQYHGEDGKIYRKYIFYTLGILIVPAIIKVMFF